jgi:hypothetical protein
MQLRSDSKRRTFVVFLAMCLLAFGAATQVSAYAAGTQRIAHASMAPVQSTIRSIRDQIQREDYSRHATASRHDARRSKR